MYAGIDDRAYRYLLALQQLCIAILLALSLPDYVAILFWKDVQLASASCLRYNVRSLYSRVVCPPWTQLTRQCCAVEMMQEESLPGRLSSTKKSCQQRCNIKRVWSLQAELPGCDIAGMLYAQPHLFLSRSSPDVVQQVLAYCISIPGT